MGYTLIIFPLRKRWLLRSEHRFVLILRTFLSRSSVKIALVFWYLPLSKDFSYLPSTSLSLSTPPFAAHNDGLRSQCTPSVSPSVDRIRERIHFDGSRCTESSSWFTSQSYTINNNDIDAYTTVLDALQVQQSVDVIIRHLYLYLLSLFASGHQLFKNYMGVNEI